MVQELELTIVLVIDRFSRVNYSSTNVMDNLKKGISEFPASKVDPYNRKTLKIFSL